MLIILAPGAHVLVYHQSPAILLWNQVQAESSRWNLKLFQSETGWREQRDGGPAVRPNFTVLNLFLVSGDRNIANAYFVSVFKSTSAGSVFLLPFLLLRLLRQSGTTQHCVTQQNCAHNAHDHFAESPGARVYRGQLS